MTRCREASASPRGQLSLSAARRRRRVHEGSRRRGSFGAASRPPPQRPTPELRIGVLAWRIGMAHWRSNAEFSWAYWRNRCHGRLRPEVPVIAPQGQRVGSSPTPQSTRTAISFSRAPATFACHRQPTKPSSFQPTAATRCHCSQHLFHLLLFVL